MATHDPGPDFELPRISQHSTFWMGVGMLIFVGSVVFSAWRVKASEETVDRNAAVIARQGKVLAQQRKQIAENEERIHNLAPAALQAYGADQGAVARVRAAKENEGDPLLAANDEFHRILAGAPGSPRGQKVVYFAKGAGLDVNQQQLVASLRDVGFDIVARTPVIEQKASNTVWAGAGVDPRNVKLIALGLLRAGYPLRMIGRFSPASAAAKRDLIEVGYSSRADTASLLTAQQVAATTLAQ